MNDENYENMEGLPHFTLPMLRKILAHLSLPLEGKREVLLKRLKDHDPSEKWMVTLMEILLQPAYPKEGDVNIEDLSYFTVPMLKKILAHLGLSQEGTRDVLLKRLNDHDPSRKWMVTLMETLLQAARPKESGVNIEGLPYFKVPILRKILAHLGLSQEGTRDVLLKKLNDHDPSGAWMVKLMEILSQAARAEGDAAQAPCAMKLAEDDNTLTQEVLSSEPSISCGSSMQQSTSGKTATTPKEPVQSTSKTKQSNSDVKKERNEDVLENCIQQLSITAEVAEETVNQSDTDLQNLQYLLKLMPEDKKFQCISDFRQIAEIHIKGANPNITEKGASPNITEEDASLNITGEDASPNKTET